MAETALGMATTMVASALGAASSAAREEMGLLLGVHDDIWFINVELKMMGAFLRTTSVADGNTELLKAYLELIRDLAYDTEDCLEEFKVSIKNKNMLQQCLSLGTRHRIAVQIRAIKKRIQDLNHMRKRYNLNQITSTIPDDMRQDFQETRNFAAMYSDEAQLVGFEKPKAELLGLVSSKTDAPKVVSIVGMGGLGKTTLAKKVYDSKEVHERFAYRAWITVSQSFSIMELLKDLIKQLLGAESLIDLMNRHPGVNFQVQHLIDHLRERLHGGRHFIVLDDLWTVEAWSSIKFAFPEHSNEDSCVVVTTRNIDVAKLCGSLNSTLIYKLKALAEKDAKELLLKKIRGPYEDKLVDEILNKCGGLPLAIVTIGGLLANIGINEWKSLRDQLPSELANNPSLEALRQVVTLSYKHLPSHLKPCFLYVSLFPEDINIWRQDLVNKWIAEGYIVTTHTGRRTLEEIAESYFYELINRSLIQPSRFNVLGDVKACRVHDIVHDIAVSLSRQENHVLLVEGHTNTTTATNQSIRHVSCFAEKKLDTSLVLAGVRSFTLFCEIKVPLASFCLSRFKMLRVLDLSYAEFRQRKQDSNIIGSLIHLKYLCYPSANWPVVNYALPRSIGNLRGLQNLDMRSCSSKTLPVEITKLQNLRSLRCASMKICYCLGTQEYIDCLTTARPICSSCQLGEDGISCCCCYCCISSSGVGVPKGMGRLKELQVLEDVDIKRSSGRAIEELAEMPHLRKLVVSAFSAPKKKCKIFAVTLEKLSSLRSLCVDAPTAHGSEPMKWLVSISSPPPFLKSLKLYGYVEKIPTWVGQSLNLVKVKLRASGLKDVEALAQLPNLMVLDLGDDTCTADKLVFRSHTFPKLKFLDIHSQEELRELSFEESASPQMEKIIIERCYLTSGISGIKHLENLKELSIESCDLAKADMLQQEVDTHSKRPELPLLQMKSVRVLDPEINQGYDASEEGSSES